MSESLSPPTAPPQAAAPPPLPVVVDAVPPPLARPAGAALGPHMDGWHQAAGRTDKLAVASAVCGVTAFVPVVSQIAGLGLGVASLMRIRRAKKQGIPLRGAGWAWTGILSSGFVLCGWIAAAGILAVVGASLSNSTSALDVLTNMQP